MPGVIIPGFGCLDFGDEYKPGDPPPSGYCDWHEWADVQAKAGLEQQKCGGCGLWSFPQELSGKSVRGEGTKSDGETVVYYLPICLKCVENYPDAQPRTAVLPPPAPKERKRTRG
jgi:hypothetical protein